MVQHKTLLEMAQCRVAKSEAQVAQQTALVSNLAQQGRDTAQEEALLVSFKHTLCVMRDVLARQQEREAKARRRRPRHR